ncbi:putative periplasmic protein [Salmonella enterica subsp. salamae]|nr:putative periplasmic protein [Salmonella enterica subsp. salamae serovar Greenside]VEA04975.1 putative periplasmic protein [Salmonella enterica subsp. salamae]VEA62468.1 putative periplasmic protein [Salmonella enterica subsp. salamae]
MLFTDSINTGAERIGIKGEKRMELYKDYPAHVIFLRRAFAVTAGVLALPVMLFWKDRARFYSYLHRVWSKTSDKPVWMEQAEKATCDFY